MIRPVVIQPQHPSGTGCHVDLLMSHVIDPLLSAEARVMLFFRGDDEARVGSDEVFILYFFCGNEDADLPKLDDLIISLPFFIFSFFYIKK